MPKSCVWKINRNGSEVRADRLEIESFGATIGALTREVFGLEVRQSGFHKMLIDESIKKAKKTLVLIGSMQEKGTLRNPFSYDTRKRLIEKIYKDESSIIISGLEDMSNEHDISYEWGRYILDNVYEFTGKKPDLFVYGNDESRQGWFSEEDKKYIEENGEVAFAQKHSKCPSCGEKIEHIGGCIQCLDCGWTKC